MNLWVSVHARERNDDVVPACRHRWISVDWHNRPEESAVHCLQYFCCYCSCCPIGDVKDRLMIVVFELLRRFDCFWISSSSLLKLLLLRLLIWFWLAEGGCCWLLLVSQYKKRREAIVIFHTDEEAVVAVGGVSWWQRRWIEQWQRQQCRRWASAVSKSPWDSVDSSEKEESVGEATDGEWWKWIINDGGGLLYP